MVRRALSLTIVAALMLVLTLFVPDPAHAFGNQDYQSVLAGLRALDPGSFDLVVQWVRAGARDVREPSSSYEQVETQILSLDPPYRYAVLSWLQGDGRAELYALGATDDQIGPVQPEVDQSVAKSSIASNAWRDLKVISAEPSQAPGPSQIGVDRAFAAVRSDGSSVLACVSFKNLASIPATRVFFEFTFLDASGKAVSTITIAPGGTFSPNIGIVSYQSLDDWRQKTTGSLQRAYDQNCVQTETLGAGAAVRSAANARYRVTRVEYAGGPAWQSTGMLQTPIE